MGSKPVTLITTFLLVARVLYGMCRLLVLEPSAKLVFEDSKKHGDVIVSFFESVFQLVGPDVEFLQEICQQVGERHKKMGIERKFFSKMGLALLHGLEVTLGDQMTKEDKDAWRDVYKEISDEILTAMK